MNKKRTDNHGFTLIELIIAIAVLAFLMTAISSMMGSSVFANKKAQADITVQTSAQDTYNKITDMVMQAKKIYVFGYTFSGTPDFTKNGEAATGDPSLKVYGLYDERKYMVKDANGKIDKAATISKNKAAIAGELLTLGYSVTPADIEFFSDISTADELYVQKLIVFSSVPLDISMVDSGNCTLVDTDKYNIYDAFEGIDVPVEAVRKGGNVVGYSKNDTLMSVFTFDDDKLYYEKQYAFMTTKNDYVTDWSDESAVKRCLYSDAIGYNTTDGDSISGCVAKIDYEAGQIGFDLHFNQKNMTYKSLGMVNVRNSYILKAKN